jgi:histidine ammonia-lyase
MAAIPIRLRHLYTDLAASLAALRRDPARVMASREHVDAALNDGQAHYGINTGFGALAQQRISAAQLGQLQRNLLLSHAVGVGPHVPPPIAELMLHTKIHALGQGYSGISLTTFRRLLDFAERQLIPVVPSRGSVGASGDLAPLAHLALPLIGVGEFWSKDGSRTISAEKVLQDNDWKPIDLAPKDGLALINGTQFMTAYGAYVLKKSLRLVIMFDIAAAMSLEALQGSLKPFDPRIHAIRPHPGQVAVAANVRALMANSEILESHRNCGKVQDPYSLRCVPQVHGASRDALNHVNSVIETELNSVSDNPLVFEDGAIISGGNFHGQPLALALDFAALALAELASISERRIYLLLEGHDGLPKLLMKETGINSGFMIPQYTAAALVSENKVLCHPASVDSIPTSLGQEDHVSMGSIAALKLLSVFENVEQVLAIELITAAQALDYRAPLRPGLGVAEAHRVIRSRIPHHEHDYYFQDDLHVMLQLVQSKTLLEPIEAAGINLA